ncbi:MAG: helix-turn-helix transcriptional regulator [Eggerthellaceae bacterium]
MRRTRDAHDATRRRARRGRGDARSRPTCAQLADVHNLTAREQEILAYLAEGHSGAYISDVLFISPNTVHPHPQHLSQARRLSREDILRLTKG